MNCFIMVWSNGINVRLNQSCWLSEVFGFDRERQLGFVVDMKKRPSVKQKNTVGSNSFGELTLCFDIWQSIAFRPSHGYEIRKKRKKAFPNYKRC